MEELHTCGNLASEQILLGFVSVRADCAKKTHLSLECIPIDCIVDLRVLIAVGYTAKVVVAAHARVASGGGWACG